jgi:hypothetical protein
MMPEKLLTLSMTPKKGRRVVVEVGIVGCTCLEGAVEVVLGIGGCSSKNIR